MRKVSFRDHHAETPYQAGRKWDRIYVETPFRYGKGPSPIAKRVAGLLRPSSTVVELGGGYGRDAVFLAKMGHRVISMDLSEEARAVGEDFAEQEGVGGRVIFFTMDVSKGLGLRPESTDAVYANLLFNLIEPGDVGNLLGGIRDALVPGGRLLFGVRTMQDPDYLEGESVSKNVKRCNGFICYFYGNEQAKALVMGSGFSAGKMEHVQETMEIAGKETVADLYLFELIK